jgi:aspartate carbamoyltransferase catalytic subunit
MNWKGRSLVSIRQTSRTDIEAWLTLASAMQADPAAYHGLLSRSILATLFFEPSTRTRLSFESAMARLGGHVISTPNANEMSSAVKGETLSDTIRMVNGYADVIALRHPHEGASAEAARVADIPVLNAGDGAGEHPTQALLDAYAIRRHHGTLDGITVTALGDLAYGRTVHSLALLLAKFDNVTLRTVAPEGLEFPSLLAGEVRAQGLKLEAFHSLGDAVRDADVLYVTRLQKERLPEHLRNLAGAYALDRPGLAALPQHALIMHPLPRVDELPEWVDTDPRAGYFDQAKGGVFVRMACLATVLGAMA